MKREPLINDYFEDEIINIFYGEYEKCLNKKQAFYIGENKNRIDLTQDFQEIEIIKIKGMKLVLLSTLKRSQEIVIIPTNNILNFNYNNSKNKAIIISSRNKRAKIMLQEHYLKHEDGCIHLMNF